MKEPEFKITDRKNRKMRITNILKNKEMKKPQTYFKLPDMPGHTMS